MCSMLTRMKLSDISPGPLGSLPDCLAQRSASLCGGPCEDLGQQYLNTVSTLLTNENATEVACWSAMWSEKLKVYGGSDGKHSQLYFVW